MTRDHFLVAGGRAANTCLLGAQPGARESELEQIALLHAIRNTRAAHSVPPGRLRARSNCSIARARNSSSCTIEAARDSLDPHTPLSVRLHSRSQRIYAMKLPLLRHVSLGSVSAGRQLCNSSPLRQVISASADSAHGTRTQSKQVEN
eukprot:2092581-Rhodomonas_salina.4